MLPRAVVHFTMKNGVYILMKHLIYAHLMCIMCLRGEGMKRRVLIKKLTDNGWWLLRTGANHDIYTNGTKSEPIPRHREVNEMLAHAIIKRQGLK